MKPSLQLRIGHQLTMTHQLQQAIRLLQLSAVDLQTEVQSALETNSMLELEDPSSQNANEGNNQEANRENTSESNLESNQESHRESKELAQEQESIEDTYNNMEQNTHEALEEERSWEMPRESYAKKQFQENTGNELETLNGTQISLQDYLLWQMQLTPFSDVDSLIAATIIDAINEDGFVTCTIEDIINSLKSEVDVEKAEVQAVLHRIQQFDPLGVGARDLSECLKIQLENLPQTPQCEKACELVSHYLDLLAKRDYATLRRRLGLTVESLRDVIQCIQSLNPRPGSKIGENTAEYIIPDVFAYKKQGLWRVKLNPDCTPQLRINHTYASMIRRKDISDDNQFLRNQLQEARWFLKSIENRNETLLKVAHCIVEQQQAFFEQGEEAMKPLILHQIASVLNLHESTISRVTTQKYLHTPRGTFELKYFFSSSLDTQEGGECSATAIRALIKKYIHTENPEKPFSDSSLSNLLFKKGIKVARRTVAKYREAMAIPPSNERKQLV